MSKQHLLKKYKQDVNNLRTRARNLNISDAELKEMFENCFEIISHNVNNREAKNNQIKCKKILTYVAKCILCLLCIAFVVYIVLNVHQPTSSIVLRNVQGLIYPGLKLLRSLTVPIIKSFPSLTALYDESCLLENPYFYVSNMECWPCENVHSVIDLTGFNNYSLYKSGVPYVVQTKQEHVTFKHLQEMYLNNNHIFNEDANAIKSKNYVNSVRDLFHRNLSTSDHFSWRINRMAPARILRKLFPKPYIVSEWSGQSIERYVMVDGPKSTPYAFPNFECSYIFVIQGSGEQTIILRPSRECGNHCKTVSVILKPSYVLWYNWWYWRPISLPAENSTDFSISYISSYC